MVTKIKDDIEPVNLRLVGSSYALTITREDLEYLGLLDSEGKPIENLTEVRLVKKYDSGKYGNYLGIGVDKRQQL